MPSMEEHAGVPATFDGTYAGMRGAMEAAGIDVAVLQPVATRPDQVCSINDWTAGLAGDHVVSFGAIHPDFEGVAEEFARMRSLGIRGVKLHPEFQLCAPDDERMHPIYEAADAEGLIILFHAGIDIAIDTLTGTPDVFARVHEAYPGLRIVLAHMGGFRMWDEVREHLVGRDVWLDTSYTLGHLPDEEFVDLALIAHKLGLQVVVVLETPDELDRMTAQMGDILRYMELLSEVDTEDVEPMAHAVEVHDVFREDRARPHPDRTGPRDPVRDGPWHSS